jgi:hypothetical protein
MDCFGDEIFAGSAFSFNQNGLIGLGNPPDDFKNLLHFGMIPDDIGEGIFLGDFFSKIVDLPLHLLSLEGLADDNKKPEKRAELRLAVNAGSVLEDDDQRGRCPFMRTYGF